MTSCARRSCWVLASLLACHDDGGSSGEGSSSSEGSGNTTTTITATTTSTTGDEADTSVGSSPSSSESSVGSESSTGATPVCGDGQLDADELCDDGNTTPADGCSEACVPSGTVFWEVIYDGPTMGLDGGSAVALDSVGNILVAAYESVTDHGIDILLQKRDPLGALTWSRGHDGLASLDDFSYDVVVDANDNPVIAGTAHPDASSINSFVRMFDPGGATTWTAIGDLDDPRAMAVADDGDIVVVGRVDGGSPDIAIVRLGAADGMPVWSTTYDGPGASFDMGNAVAIADDGSVIVAGSVTVAGVNSDAAIIAYDGDGNLLWDATFDGAAGGFDGWNSVAIDATGAIVVGGYEEVVALEAVVHGYSADGTDLLFEQSFADDSNNNLLELVIDPSGDIVVCGIITPDAAFPDRWFARLDAAGNVIWTATLADPDNDGCSDLAIADNGEIIAVGYMNEPNDLWLAALVP